MVDTGSLNGPVFLLVLANCVSPYIGVNSIRDCKVRGEGEGEKGGQRGRGKEEEKDDFI